MAARTTAIIITLIQLLVGKQHTQAALPLSFSLPQTPDDGLNNINDMISALNYKMETYTKTLIQLETTLQGLEEKSQHWVILKHHIEAWNSQMLALEQKLEAMQRTQNNNNAYWHKNQPAFDSILNEILNKVELIAENTRFNMDQSTKQESITMEREALVRDFEKATSVFKKAQTEATAKLNNILRFAHNMEYRSNKNGKKNCPTIAVARKDGKEDDLKSVNLIENGNMIPDVKKYLTSWESKLITMVNPAQKEMKHLLDQTKKQTKNLDIAAKSLASIEHKLAQWHDNAENNVNYM